MLRGYNNRDTNCSIKNLGLPLSQRFLQYLASFQHPQTSQSHCRVSSIPFQSLARLPLLFLYQRSPKMSAQNSLILFFSPQNMWRDFTTFQYVYLVNHTDRNPYFWQGHFQLSGPSRRVGKYKNRFTGIYVSDTCIYSQGIYLIMSSLLRFVSIRHTSGLIRCEDRAMAGRWEEGLNSFCYF